MVVGAHGGVLSGSGKGVAVLMRQWIRVGAALVAVVVIAIGLVGCHGRGRDSVVLREGEVRVSSSGRYVLELSAEEADGRHSVYPVIKNSAGEVVWTDDERYLASAHPVEAVWQEDADVLWLLSTGSGTCRVLEKDGKWDKDPAVEPPSDIRERGYSWAVEDLFAEHGGSPLT